MLRAVIIDDEQKGIDSLKMLIELFVPEIKVVAEATRPELSLGLIENYKPEIVFLDINMPDMNGFQVLEKLQWREFHLVFTTAHQEYALKALKNNAFDYLLKPIDHEELQETVQKIQNKIAKDAFGGFNYEALRVLIKQKSKSKILVNSKAGAEYIDVQEIIYLESSSNYTQIVLNDSRRIVSPCTLKEFEAELCSRESNFMRVHHSFIVNLEKISRYLKGSEDIIMTNDQKIPIAKSKKEVFIQWLDI